MKKTNFFKLLTVGVAALSLGFASCNYAKEADFKALCDDVETLQNDLKALQTQVDGLKYVVSVVETPAGSGSWLVTDSANQTVTIKTGTPQGPVASGTLSVGDNGNWFIGETDTQVKANATMPRIGTEGDQKYWEFPVINEGKVEWVKGAAAVAYTYAVNNGGQWSLWVPTKDKPNELSEIKLPGASAGLGKIDILGWVDGYDAATENLATNPDAAAASETQYEGKTADMLNPKHVAVRNNPDDTFVVYYSWIKNFYTDTNFTTINGAAKGGLGANLGQYGTGALPLYGGYYTGTKPTGTDIAGPINEDRYTYPNIYTPGPRKADAYEWHVNATPAEDFGAVSVKRYEVMTTLDSDNKGFLVQVHPLTADISNMDFTLQDSKGNQLPIAFKKPVLVTGLMTRAAAQNSGVWFIEGQNPAGTFEGFTNDTKSGRVDFATKFTTNTVWSLVTPDGVRSEYTPFTITPSYVRSRENQVAGVLEGEGANKTATEFGDVPVGGGNLVPAKAYEIHVDQWITPKFENVTVLRASGVPFNNDFEKHSYETAVPNNTEVEIADPVGNGWAIDQRGFSSNAVVDWYFRVGSNEWDEAFITKTFGLQYSPDRTSFRATIIPDELTRASFWMDIYKLGVDGTIYYERVPIHLIREDVVTEIEVPYFIQDEYPKTDEDYLSSALEVPLDKMFTELATHTVPNTSTNRADRWKDETYGAYYYSFTDLRIEDQTPDVNQLHRFMLGSYVTMSSVKDATSTLITFDPAVIGGTTGTSPIADNNDGTTWRNIENFTNTAVTPNAPFASVGQGADKFGLGAMGLVPVTTNPDKKIDGMFDVRSFNLYPNYAYVDGAGEHHSFVRDKKHTFTVKFYDGEKRYLNTIKIIVTPKIPVLDNLFKKDLNRWDSWPNTDPAQAKVLYAYYDTPVVPWRETKFYGTDYVTDGDWLNTATYIGSTALGATEDIKRNSTYYNVFNPGGTTSMKHSEYRPLDGGYLKVGNRGDSENPKQWIDNTAVALRTPTAAFEGKTYADFLKTPASAAINAANGTDYASSGFTAHTIVQLLGQTNDNVPLTAPDEVSIYDGLPKSSTGNAYNKVVPMMWDLGKYIHYYEYTDEEKAKNNFDIRIMSAIEKNADAPEVGSKAGLHGGEKVENMGSVITKLTKENIYMTDYAGNRREVFKEWVQGLNLTNNPGQIGYAYNYIAKVWFSRPDEISDYDIYDANSQIENEGSTAIDPGAKAADGTYAASYLPIMTKNVVGAKTTAIHVKVYDRFGRTLEGDVPFNIVDEK